MSPLRRRTLTLAIAGLGILAYRHPAVRRFLTLSRDRRALPSSRGEPVQILPLAVREKYVR